MKKFLLTLAALLTCSMALWAEGELTVSDGSVTNGSVPINGLWVDSEGTTSQCIYPAEMLAEMNGENITIIKFYLTNNGIQFKNCTLAFSMGETVQTEYESATAIEGLTLVKTWEVGDSHTGETELVLELDAPFAYQGGNLVFECKVTTTGAYGSTYFYGQNMSGYVSFSRSSRANFLPKTTFTYGEKAEYEAKLTPQELNFGKVALQSEKTMTLKLKNNGQNAFTPALSSLSAPFSTTYTAAELAPSGSVEIPVTYAPTAPGDYTGTLTIDCGQAGSFAVPLSGYSLNEMELTVCDGTEQSAYFPTYGYWFDNTGTMDQMLYPAEQLAEIVGCQIIGVRFYPESTIGFGNGDLRLSMAESDIVQYESAGVSSEPTNLVSEVTPVATTTVTAGDTELEFGFDAPVTYEGGTLVLQTNVSRAGSYLSTYFLGTNADEGVYMSYCKYSTNHMSSRFMPKMTIIYTKTQEDPVEPVYYVVGGFNGWSQQEGMVEIGEAGASITVEAQDLSNPEDESQEFKIITAAQDGGWIWYGGQDANGAGYFGITEELLGQPITLDDGTAPAVQNFRLPTAGTYTIKLVQERNEVEGLKMVVTKETVTAIDAVKSEVKGDNNYYNLMGQKMNGNNLPAGIYIHNGKKIIVK